jgi:MerR family transcriptional regulator, thiopeptide resistance regulator
MLAPEVLHGVHVCVAQQLRNPAEMLDVFGDFDPTQFADEVEQRWDDTNAESKRRTAKYGKAQWQAIKQEAEAIEAALANAMAAGLPADNEDVMDIAEQHRQHISRWFYDCSYEMHQGLAEMYVADPRFAAHYDGRAEGLSEYVRDAVLANASRADS